MQEAKLLNANDVCKQLGICYAHLRRLINNQDITYINVGARMRASYRFTQKDVDEFIERKRVSCLNHSGASLGEITIPHRRTKPSPYEIIDFVGQRAARKIQKPKGGWHKRKRTTDK